MEKKPSLIMSPIHDPSGKLHAALFRDLLGAQTTYFPNAVDNAVNNIRLAACKLDGAVLLPSESLSWNQTIGQRTPEAGYLAAGAFADSGVVQEVGGGICQVSTTLYWAVILANLETVERTNHDFRVGYVPIGFDAAVSWPEPDFIFRNNRNYPVKIHAYTDAMDRCITVEIWGTDENGTRVVLRNDGEHTIYDSKYTATAIGTSTTTFREIHDAAGKLLKTVRERYSEYKEYPEDIEWPPEKLAANAAAAHEG